MKDILNNLPNLGEQKGLLLRLVILALLVFGVFYASGSLMLSYNDRQEKLEQISMMEKYLGEWRVKATKLSDAPFRPIAKDKTDKLQTSIILRLQSLNLELNGLQEMTGRKEESGRIFELEFSGSYNETMQCLNNFGANDALIAIKNLSMSMRDNKIVTKLTYKIYTK